MNARKTFESPASDATQSMQRGLKELFHARQYAEQLDRDTWDFAVEISSLRQLGMTHSDLRWLVCKRYVEHACEVSMSASDCRRFHPHGQLTFTRRTCFVLTQAGFEFVQTLPNTIDGPIVLDGPSRFAPNRPRHSGMVPTWDAYSHQLKLGNVVVSDFKLPLKNQSTVLAAFEEQLWPPRIDDPLPPCGKSNARQRLNETVRGLNRNQKQRLIFFSGDANSEGICWEFIKR